MPDVENNKIKLAPAPSRRSKVPPRSRTRKTKRAASISSTTAAAAKPSCTLFQGFDALPAGPLDPHTYYNGLRYEGFSVFDNNGGLGTYFSATTPLNTLRLSSHSGSIHALPGEEVAMEFFDFGCSKDDNQQACFLTIDIPGRPMSGSPNTTSLFFFPVSGTPDNELEIAGGVSGEEAFGSSFLFTISGPDVGKFPGGRKGVNLFLDNLVYVETGCAV